ncbi:DUF421 domain-containing protein [Candidatus Contubernalis alkaliaceticus]|uniref:DUF421 domain-containing protein n=1 Tax=Candidatus Contubernalis alkaliaceticus TaxID=338645 RepID=UPI001F4C41C3|nr:DUF421 domain-containing protein [Candidatus Contubernalis alkalaceticus]UNC93304.1 DUF421 domain-containing protein [Candidatus Contubernalis alkalaceticus]
MPIWIVILRSILLLFLVLFLVRIMGKRNPSRLIPFKFIIYVMIGVTAVFTAVGALNLFLGVVVLAVFTLLPIGLEVLSVRSKFVHDVVNGRETVLIKEGTIMEENLNQVRLTGEDLLRELRYKNVFNLNDVEFAVMEATGDINMVLKSDKKPITPKDLEWKVSPQTEPQTVILDGSVLNEPLTEMGLNRNWLEQQLETMGISLENVFVGQMDTVGELYVDLFDDTVSVSQPKVRELLYANLEKAQAELSGYALETEDQEAKDVFSGDAQRLEGLLQKLRPQLLR